MFRLEMGGAVPPIPLHLQDSVINYEKISFILVCNLNPYFILKTFSELQTLHGDLHWNILILNEVVVTCCQGILGIILG
jgi:hypothetical protein